MGTLKRFSLGALALPLAIILLAYIYLYVLHKGPELTEIRPLDQGKDSFVVNAYKHTDRKSIRVWTYQPAHWTDGGSVLFVMHGAGRNAEDYLDAWIEIANRKSILLIAPEFGSEFKPYVTNDYQEGNLKTFFGVSNTKSEWAYTVIERIFDHINEVNNFSLDGYNIFGHSAGGQFVHRMVLLMPSARIKKAIAANAGYYTFPDLAIQFPYGLGSIEDQLKKSLSTELIVLLGELDNNANLGLFIQTDEAMAQGSHRLERGTRFFDIAQDLSIQKKYPFNWKLQVVPDVGHNYKKMSVAAAELL